MMKLLRLALLCFGIVTAVAGDSTPSNNEVTSSGDGFSTAETDTSSTATEVIEGNTTNSNISDTATSQPAVVTTESPCASAPCPSNSECNVIEGSYACKCNEPYQLQGDACIIVCKAEEVSVYNGQVYYDVTDEDCQNISSSPPSNNSISVVFAQSQVGTTVTANVTCNTTCDSNIAPGAIGYVTCDKSGTFSTPTWIDCSLTNPSSNQQLSSAVIATSNPGDVTSDTVTDTVQIMQDVSAQETIPTNTADEFMVVTNNLLRGSGNGAQETVQSNSDMIIQSVQNTSQNVVLEPAVNSSYNTYENVQSEIAMGVVQVATPTTKEAQVQQRATDTPVYYVLGADVTTNLANTGVTLMYSTPSANQAYISATPSGGKRLSYVVYTSVQQLFPNTEANILSNNIVFGVNGSDSYTMQFPITSDISIDAGATNQFDNGKRRLDCIIWDIVNARWNSASDCSNYAANNNFASCTCTTEGQYSMRSVTIENPPDELSAGAIVGIVIGSVAGAAIIAGLVYYFGFRKKKHHDVHMHDSGSISSRL